MLRRGGRGVQGAPRVQQRVSFLATAACLIVGLFAADTLRERSLARRTFPPFAAATGRLATPAVRGDGTMARGVLVVSPGDCNGNLKLPGLMLRGPRNAIREQLEIVVVGNSQDTLQLREALPAMIRRNRMRLLRSEEHQMLVSIGHRGTPVLLLYDEASRLRLATHTDADPVARLAFARALSHFINREPSS